MSMKKIVSLFLCVAMIFAASALAESAITPGTYEGAGEGFDAAGIKVNVTLNEEGIEAIEVLENNETPPLAALRSKFRASVDSKKAMGSPANGGGAHLRVPEDT